jgi:hypothetical protein
MEQTQCSETPAHKTETPGNHSKKEYKFLFTPLVEVWLSIYRFSRNLGSTGRNSFAPLSGV